MAKKKDNKKEDKNNDAKHMRQKLANNADERKALYQNGIERPT